MPAAGGNSKNFDINFRLVVQDAATAIVNQVRGQMDSLGQSAAAAGKQVQDSMKNMATGATRVADTLDQLQGTFLAIGATAAGIGASLGAAFKGAVTTAADFQQEMLNVKAITSASDKEFEKLTATARKLGEQTKFTATEAAQGMKFLGMAGFDTNQIISALPPTLDLAEATAMNLGQAADYVSNIMQGFGLKAEETSRATDVLAMTAKSSNTNVAQLAEGMKYVAPVARAMGQSIELTAAAMGALGDAGIQASMGGTSLRRIYLALASPTAEAQATLAKMNVQVAKNDDGTINLIETLKRFKAARIDAAEAEKIFGVYAVSSAIALKDNLEKVETLTKKNQESKGALEQWVGTARTSFTAAMTRLSSSWGGFMEAMGAPLLDTLSKLVDGITAIVNAMMTWARENPNLAGTITSLIGVGGLFAGIIATLSLSLAGISFLLKPLTKGWQILSTAIFGASQAQVATTETAAATSAALAAEGRQVDQLAQKYRIAGTAKEGMVAAGGAGKGRGALIAGAGVATMAAGLVVGEATKGTSYEQTGATIESWATKIGLVTVAAQGLKSVFSALSPYIEAVGGTIAKLGTGIAGTLGLSASTAGILIAGAVAWVKVLTKDVWDLLDVLGTAPKTIENIKTTFKAMADPVGAVVNLLKNILGFDSGDAAKKTKEAADKAAKVKEEAQKNEEKAEEEARKRELRSQEEQYAQLKKDADARIKITEVVHKDRMNQIDIETNSEKVSIAQRYQSRQQEQAALLQLEIQAQAARTAEIERQSAERLAIENQTFEAQKAILQKQIDTTTNNDEKEKAQKKLTDLERTHANETLKIQADLTQQLAKQIEDQLKKRAEYVNKIQELEQQARDNQRNTAQLLRNIDIGASDQYQQLNMKLDDANRKLKDANELFPQYPEKAVELAKQAQQEFSSLGQNLSQLNQQMRSDAQLILDTIRDINDIGLKGVQKYIADRESVLTTMRRAQQEEQAGRFKEAEALYKQAIGQAKSLASGAPANIRDEAKGQALAIVDVAGKRLMALGDQQYEKAKKVNEDAKAGIQRAGDLLEANIKRQVESTQKLIDALDKNTAVLQGQYESARAASGVTGTGEYAGTSYAEADKQAAEAASKYDPFNNAVKEVIKGMKDTSDRIDQATQKVGSVSDVFSSSAKIPSGAVESDLGSALEATLSGKTRTTKTASEADQLAASVESAFGAPTGGTGIISRAIGGVPDQISRLKDSITMRVIESLGSLTDRGGVGGPGDRAEFLQKPLEDMKNFGDVMREIAKLFREGMEADRNISITVNADGSTTMIRGGGQYDNW